MHEVLTGSRGVARGQGRCGTLRKVGRGLGLVMALGVACLTGAASGQPMQPDGPIPPAGGSPTPQPAPGSVTLRVATFNLEDVRTEDLRDGSHPRLRRLAEVIQRIRPTIILLNELTYDVPGAPGVPEDAAGGENAQRFADLYLAQEQVKGLPPVRYRAYVWPTNTGMHSGFDLDNDGKVVLEYPAPTRSTPTEPPPPAGPEGRVYGNDCWGFGSFPGQYAMALLVDERLAVLTDQVRTFQRLPWDYMPGAFLPLKADGSPWYDAEELAEMRLSSKSHWDVPVRLPNGRLVHVLCSHPTPPAFDGDEQRNKRRNHDEIRFWRDYVDDQTWIVDDQNRGGGLYRDRLFVIVGDLNADPDEGSSLRDPIDTLLATSPRIAMDVVPMADEAVEGLDPDDTAAFKLRVDYVIPARGMRVRGSGVWRRNPILNQPGQGFPSDHYPVWMDLEVPPPPVNLPTNR